MACFTEILRLAPASTLLSNLQKNTMHYYSASVPSSYHLFSMMCDFCFVPNFYTLMFCSSAPQSGIRRSDPLMSGGIFSLRVRGQIMWCAHRYSLFQKSQWSNQYSLLYVFCLEMKHSGHLQRNFVTSTTQIPPGTRVEQRQQA